MPQESHMTTLSLADTVERVTAYYLEVLGDHDASNLYQQVLEEVERPLLKVVLEHTNRNQTRAAEYLGISRGTLRKKLQHYSLL